MSDYAQKRDVLDPRTVADFARIVETPKRLRLLLVLTVADIRAVGPGVWKRLERPAHARGSTARPRRCSVAAAGPTPPPPSAAITRTPPTTRARAPDRRRPGCGRMGAGHGGRLLLRLPGPRNPGPWRPWRGVRPWPAVRRPRPRSGLTSTPPRWSWPPPTASACRPRRRRHRRGGQYRRRARLHLAPGPCDRHLLCAGRHRPCVRGQRPGPAPPTGAVAGAAAREELPRSEPRKVTDFGRAAAFTITPTVMLDNEASEVSTVIEASAATAPACWSPWRATSPTPVSRSSRPISTAMASGRWTPSTSPSPMAES